MYAEIVEAIPFRQRFDTFCDDLYVHLIAQPYQAAHDGLSCGIGINIPDQIHIYLDDIGLKIRKQPHSGITSPKVIDRGLESATLVFPKNFGKPGTIVNPLPFSHLKDDPFERKIMTPCRFQGGAYAYLRSVDRIGQEVDGDVLLDAQTAGPLDSLDPASLIETVTVLFVHLGQDGHRTFPTGPAHQGFVRKYRSFVYIHNGLVCVVKLELQTLAFSAVLAIMWRTGQWHKIAGERWIDS